jgi:hypothetical protein
MPWIEVGLCTDEAMVPSQEPCIKTRNGICAVYGQRKRSVQRRGAQKIQSTLRGQALIGHAKGTL